MIRNDQEYRDAVERLAQEATRLEDERKRWESLGLTPDEIKRALDPVRSFRVQLQEEVESYERLKRGHLDELRNLRGLGQMLICFRIATGLTQRELAERLGVHESQVSRDERNEYHGVTLERAAKIMDCLGIKMTLTTSLPDSLSSGGNPVSV